MGSGKTQLCFSICAINSINNKKTLYIDGSGNFRPERIKSMIDKDIEDREKSNQYLKNIAYQRVYNLDNLTKLIKKTEAIDFDFIILDDIIPMFLYQFNDNTRIEIRKLIRDLSLITLSKKINIIFTNIIIEKTNTDKKNNQLRELFFHDIIRYVHYKFYLKKDLNNEKITELKLVHPYEKSCSKAFIDLSKL